MKKQHEQNPRHQAAVQMFAANRKKKEAHEEIERNRALFEVRKAELAATFQMHGQRFESKVPDLAKGLEHNDARQAPRMCSYSCLSISFDSQLRNLLKAKQNWTPRPMVLEFRSFVERATPTSRSSTFCNKRKR
jgi:hypothetical protein